MKEIFKWLRKRYCKTDLEYLTTKITYKENGLFEVEDNEYVIKVQIPIICFKEYAEMVELLDALFLNLIDENLTHNDGIALIRLVNDIKNSINKMLVFEYDVVTVNDLEEFVDKKEMICR